MGLIRKSYTLEDLFALVEQVNFFEDLADRDHHACIYVSVREKDDPSHRIDVIGSGAMFFDWDNFETEISSYDEEMYEALVDARFRKEPLARYMYAETSKYEFFAELEVL